MSDKNILERDVEIPEIVQKKADLAFSQIYERKDEKAMDRSDRKVIKFVRRTVAAVVAAALIFTGVKLYFANHEVAGAENLFAIKVCAAELKDGNFLPISTDPSERQFFYGTDWEGNTEYGINLPITIEGEHVENVTYRISNGCFEVVSLGGPSIAKSGNYSTGNHPNSTFTEGYDMAGQFIGETFVEYFDSFTMDYEVMQNSKYIINIVDSLTGRMDLYNLLINDANDDFTCAALTYMLQDVVITAEVTFSDGSTQSKNLGLFAKTYSATDVDTDGTEFTYTAMGIFCYDIDDIDAQTKEMIDGQISDSWIYCFEDGAPAPDALPAEGGENNIDANNGEDGGAATGANNVNSDDMFSFNLPGFDTYSQLGGDYSTGMILEKSGREFKIILGEEDEAGYFDISLKYGDVIAENITGGDSIIDNVVVEKDANTAYAVLILGTGGDTERTVVFILTDSGISEYEEYDYANYDFPNL